MNRDYGTEIDELRKDIAEIKNLLDPKQKYAKKWSPESEAKVSEVKRWAAANDSDIGAIIYHGFFESGNREAKWNLRNCVKDLLDMPQDKLSVVLTSLGNLQRWEILCALLKKPMTAAQLVEEFDMKTSGKAYHHLKSLIAADLLEEVKDAEKGTYAVKGHRVAGVILIMTGVYQLIDTYYSSGEWKE